MSNQRTTANSKSIEQRLAILEKELAALKKRFAEAIQAEESEEPWYLKNAGIFANDPVFDEIVRLGREIRQADRPE